MMILRSSPASPFGRKVKIAASLLGLTDQISIRMTDTQDPADDLPMHNPLGKIPVLIRPDGSTLYDSRVICEYLDSLATTAKIYPQGEARWQALRLAALADGLMDASILIVYETRFRPEAERSKPWTERQQAKVQRSLAALESAPPALTAQPDIGQITLACALGYRDLRFEGAWRPDHPRLVAWLDQFARAVPAFEATRMVS